MAFREPDLLVFTSCEANAYHVVYRPTTIVVLREVEPSGRPEPSADCPGDDGVASIALTPGEVLSVAAQDEDVFVLAPQDDSRFVALAAIEGANTAANNQPRTLLRPQ